MLRPLGDRVWVKPDEREHKIGSVLLPENIQQKPHAGIVLAVGQGNVNSDGSRTKPDVQEGDHVLFSQYVGVSTELAGSFYLILREGDILGVLDDAAVAETEARSAAA